MDEKLNMAAGGYLAIDSRLRIIEMNQTLKELLEIDDTPKHMHEVLTVPSRIFFQTYFNPSIHMHKKVNEMYLTLKSKSGKIPVLMNTVERDGLYQCILLPMTIREEYEKELLLAKRNAEKFTQEATAAYEQLQQLLQNVERKQLELEALNEQLLVLAMTDSLTGLKNRRYLDENLDTLIAELRGNGQFLAVLLLDIDHFKSINDTYGHAIGDAVLRELAWKLQEKVPTPGVVIRLGGEEFVVILPGNDGFQAADLAENLRSSLEKSPWDHVNMTISIGGALLEPADNALSLLKKADQALYGAKESGRNRVLFHSGILSAQ
ncbi:GGDEF domain-containing protein [Planococcus shenhongbingii]|uniref:GGDEF domain-containing protein n=1 Tax=Planococcus shenhongbingii TaxID=3058398 RepID=UPI00261325AF|nr:GGDEF domain-containing protein [Planococcus sp. N016]WKA58335.1 GGDEF domain-containing protein [Planococcus sp. N016]